MKEIILKGIDEKIYYEKLDNGLPVYMWVNEKVNNFYITLSVKYGSVDTEYKCDGDKEITKVHDGVAHFLEHVNFNEDEGVTAHDYFNALGSSINAFTTFDFTSYEVMASNDFEKNINHLLDYVQKPYFTKELVEKEKGIICEEVKMGKNRPGHKLYYGMNRALYKNDKRRIYVTGDIEDVKATTVDELKNVFETFYHPENMFLIITGNFNPQEAIAIVKENQAKKDFISYKNPEKIREVEPSSVNSKYEEIEANVEMNKVRMCYKMPKKVFKGFDDKLINIYLRIILRNNFGSTSLLNEELLENDLVVGLGASRNIFQDIVTIQIDFETKYPKEVIERIKDQMNNLSLSAEDLKRRKRASIASLIDTYDDIEYVNSDMMDQIINYGDIEDNYYGIFKQLKYEDALKVLKMIDLSNSSTVMLIPFKEKN